MMKTKISKILSSNYFYGLILLVVPFVLMVVGKMVPCYNNNDDFIMRQLVSGEYTGTPESHLVHVGYLMGVFISSLYKITATVPWYSLYLILGAYSSCVFSFFTVIKCAKKFWQKALICLVSLFMMYGLLFAHILSFQFTTVTAIVCGASIVSFYCVDEKAGVKEYLKCQIPSIIWFCISFEMRDDACVMFLPLICFLGISRFIQNRKMFKQLATYAMVLLGLMAIMFVVEKAAYHSPEWKEYLRFSTNRASIVDYEGWPDYEENKEIYEKHGVSEASYNAMRKGYMLLLDENIDADFMEDLAEINQKKSKTWQDVVQGYWEIHKGGQHDYPIDRMVFLMYAMVIIMILLTGKYKALTDVLALFCGSMIIWAYLIYIGRPVVRVTQGIYIVELLVLAAIFCHHQLWQHKANRRKWLIGMFIAFEIIGTIFVSYRWGNKYLSQIIQKNEQTEKRFTVYSELMEYCSENQDNLYLLDVPSVSYFYGDKSLLKQNGNCIWLGNWHSNSPYSDRVAEKYNIDDWEKATLEQDNVYFVFLNLADTPYAYLEDYYKEKHPEIRLEIVDSLKTSLEEEFLILKCTK